MGSLRVWALAGVAAVTTWSAASAADLPPIIQRAMPVETEFASGWYLRGDIGVSVAQGRALDIAIPVGFNTNFQMVNNAFSIGDGSFYGIGVGYQFNSWLRFDATAEYRMRQGFRAAGFYTQGGGTFTDYYEGTYRSAVLMANAYLDLGTWWCLTPFVGLGVGVAGNTVDKLYDLSFFTPGGGSAIGYNSATKTDWNFAWAAHAGVAYSVSKNFKVELAYRYLNLGNAVANPVNCGVNGQPCAGTFVYTLKDLASHDFKVGVRWMFDEPAPVFQPAPLMRKG